MKKFVLMWVALLGAVCGLCCVSAHSQVSAGSQPGALAPQAVPAALSPAELARRDSMLDPALLDVPQDAQGLRARAQKGPVQSW